MKQYDVLIVGGGHGGAQAAIALRQAKFEGSIAIIGEENEYPYERPPLSKDYFAGEKTFERILIRPVTYWAESGVDLLLGRSVDKVDPVSQAVTTSDGEVIAYSKMIWATGGNPRELLCAGANLPGVHVVRNKQDIDSILGDLDDVADVTIIGGGYIGLEAAAVLSKLKKKLPCWKQWTAC
jgi:3-phenylpropionate/trans-cinnamate dioxygenase ferredoxin reductase subunit